MEAQPRTDRRLVIGGATGLDLSWPVLRLSLQAEDEADYGVELVSRGSKVAVKAGEGDSFLRALIAGLDFEVEFDLGLEWSRSRGLTLSGTAALENRIALNLSLGPLSLTWLDLILALDGDVIRFSTGSELELRFEPFDVTIEGLGAEATLDFASETRNLGFCDLRLVFLPPTRLAFALDSEAVNGGGFVLIDPRPAATRAAWRSTSSASASAPSSSSTQVPGDPDGWALFASLGATSSGRSRSASASRSSASAGCSRCTGRSTSTSWPPTCATAPRTRSSSRRHREGRRRGARRPGPVVPAKDGTTVFGPVAEIGWGSPTMITAQLGVIALPDLIIALLGSVEMLLPTPDEAVLSLRMDVLGGGRRPAWTVIVAASLHDSNLLGVFELSGDMGFYLRLSGQPLFVLSVGGYHPVRPARRAAGWLLDLRRRPRRDPARRERRGRPHPYVAVTSNTLQFGGEFRLEASVEVLLTTYTAEGWFGINVLLVVKPFKIGPGDGRGLDLGRREGAVRRRPDGAPRGARAVVRDRPRRRSRSSGST